MDNYLAANTSLALIQAAQSDTGKAADSLKRATKGTDLEKLEHTAQEFEAVFIAEMMKPMFAGISTDPPFGGGKGEEIFRSLLLQEYGKMLSQTGSVGLADHVKTEMIRMQETIDNGSTE